MWVIAIPGTQCPKERSPREYINDKTPVKMPDTTYYQRLVGDGSLLIATPPAASTAKKNGGKE
ncbi:MAG: hypothetical protein ABSC11_03465 [Smithella sp.]|jgi:hypothetical protein